MSTEKDPHIFTCGICKQTFEIPEEEWNDEMARDEFAANFSGKDIDDIRTAIVCDDCYQIVMLIRNTVRFLDLVSRAPYN